MRKIFSPALLLFLCLSWSRLCAEGTLSLQINETAFSPNGDGRKDTAFFSLGSQGIENISKWSLQVRSARGRRVWQKNGRGILPGLVEWNGRDMKGRPASEGEYVVRVTAKAPKTKAVSPPARLILDVTPPSSDLTVSTPVFSPDGDQADETLLVALREQDKNPGARWTLRIQTVDGNALTVFTASGNYVNGVSTFVWNGMSQAGGWMANGAYRLSGETEDAAGNTTVIAPADVRVESDAELVIKKLSGGLQMETVPGGYQVTVMSRKIFENPSGALVSEKSAPFRNRLVAVAKALPDHNIMIQGYNGSGKNASQRVELSSAQAWALYSAFVKAGVPANRMEVHGQGGDKNSPNRLEIFLVQSGDDK